MPDTHRKVVVVADEIMNLCFEVNDFESRNESFKRHYYKERDEIADILSKYYDGQEIYREPMK